MAEHPTVIIGAGIAGLAAALDLAVAGRPVLVLETADRPGGKIAQAGVGDARIDCGPTVFTLKPVFDALFSEAGLDFDAAVKARPATRLARHVWPGGETLDLFQEPAASADAIGRFAGRAESRGYLRFLDDSRRLFETLDRPFMRRPEPGMAQMLQGAGLRGMSLLGRVRTMGSMWDALGRYFRDERLRQLFGRYATYCGASPFEAPATLMLVAHAEQRGVWLVDGGMQALADAVAEAAASLGAVFRFGTAAERIECGPGGVRAVVTAEGERIEAGAAIFNGDIMALKGGRLGPDVAGALTSDQQAAPSQSAVTLSMTGRVSGLKPDRHTVLFSDHYRAEFDDVFRSGRMPRNPTIYICAQDRGDDTPPPDGPERLFFLVNAPAGLGGGVPTEAGSWMTALLQRAAAYGIQVSPGSDPPALATPASFAARFPATGGALYGRALHGWQAAFQRPGNRTRIPGLYLAGGSIHPGPGVPMAAMSGRHAASCLIADTPASTPRSRRAAMPGGMSTGSATTERTRSP
ncbi:MAG: 1-hydroxycarotenoid 3,4-desaturase CrtD [Minwuia sp.]|uniref:1-hydroxycarotenoid 3,4-desaturase CrtD n=1 Tax=Minwuia sp. TaxID=2493630 RepID=UPI003A83D20C